jgi:hypothetical protein
MYRSSSVIRPFETLAYREIPSNSRDCSLLHLEIVIRAVDEMK